MRCSNSGRIGLSLIVAAYDGTSRQVRRCSNSVSCRRSYEHIEQVPPMRKIDTEGTLRT